MREWFYAGAPRLKSRCSPDEAAQRLEARFVVRFLVASGREM